MNSTTVDPRTIAAVCYACHSDACCYPSCDCALPIVVRNGLAGAEAYDRMLAQRAEGASVNPTMTLAAIRASGACSAGWKKLLVSLGGSSVPLDTKVSLGDIASSNGAPDAWWCARVLDRSDVAARRAVVRVLLLAASRATQHATDQEVHESIATMRRWCDGDDLADLIAAAEAPRVVGELRRPAITLTEQHAEMALRVASMTAQTARYTLSYALQASYAAEAAVALSADVPAMIAVEAESHRQRADLIAAFPPLHQREFPA